MGGIIRRALDALTGRKPQAAAKGGAGARRTGPASASAPRGKGSTAAGPNVVVARHPRLHRKPEQFDYWQLTVPDKRRACALVQPLANRRYQVDTAPTLPFAACDRECNCHFLGVKDQRRGQRRKNPERREAVRFDPGKVDRRQSPGRRKGDGLRSGRRD